MARSLNRASLLGNVGKDPEIRTTQTGTKVAQFSLATTKTWNNARGEKQESTQWHRCVVWDTPKGGLAGVVEQYVRKGAKVMVEGEIEYREYQDKNSQTRNITEIKVFQLFLLGGGGESGGSAPAASSAAGNNRQGGFLDDDDDLPF